MNLLGGIFLARNLNLDLRGQVAIASVFTSIFAIVANLGRAERAVSLHSAIRLEGRARPAVVLWIGAAGLACAFAQDMLFGGGTVAFGLLTSVVMLSCWTSNAVAEVQIVSGITRVLVVQFLHTLWLLLGLAMLLLASSSWTRNQVYGSWVAAETLTLWTAHSLRRASGTVFVPGAAYKPTQGLSHAMSQLGNVITDRGMLLLGVAATSAPALGLLAVAQSTLAPMNLPAIALAPSLLARSDLATPDRRRRETLAGAAIVTVLALALPQFVLSSYGIKPLFGQAYSELADAALTLTAAGVALGCWRVQHLTTRGRGRPRAAVWSDLLALASVGIFVSVHDFHAARSVALALLVYGLSGLVSINVAQWLIRGGPLPEHGEGVPPA